MTSHATTQAQAAAAPATSGGPLLDPTPPAGEEARAAAIFAAIEEDLGFVPAALRLYGVSPGVLEAFLGYIRYFREDTALSPTLTASIRYLVSDRIDCGFCIDFNEGYLVSLGHDLETVRAVRTDISKAPVEAREKSLLTLALSAVETPGPLAPVALAAARADGWSERDIFDAVSQAANNRSLNFVLKAFGVESMDAWG